MTDEIYYFSGTGNSLHIAKELKKRMEDVELVPMVRLLDKEKVKTKGKVVGFVFPLYFTTVPAQVRDVIGKMDLSSADYIFSVVTRGGTVSVADLAVEKLLKKKGKVLGSCFFLDMAMNTPTGLKPGKGDMDWTEKTSPENIEKLEETVQKRLYGIVDNIKIRKSYREPDGSRLRHRLLYMIMKPVTGNIMPREVGYEVGPECVGCGTCEDVCISGKIELRDGKPVWKDDVRCFYCFACFNYCPEQAILVRNKYSERKGRYHHPDVTAEEIAGQR